MSQNDFDFPFFWFIVILFGNVFFCQKILVIFTISCWSSAIYELFFSHLPLPLWISRTFVASILTYWSFIYCWQVEKPVFSTPELYYITNITTVTNVFITWELSCETDQTKLTFRGSIAQNDFVCCIFDSRWSERKCSKETFSWNSGNTPRRSNLIFLCVSRLLA